MTNTGAPWRMPVAKRGRWAKLVSKVEANTHYCDRYATVVRMPGINVYVARSKMDVGECWWIRYQAQPSGLTVLSCRMIKSMYKVEWSIGASDDLWPEAREDVGRLVASCAESADTSIREIAQFSLHTSDRNGEMRMRYAQGVDDFACRMKLAFLEAAEAITIQPTEPA